MHYRLALIVDEDERFIDKVIPCLRVIGLRVDVVADRRDALDYLGGHDPAVVFLSVEGAQNTGLSLYADVKRAADKIPVILATSTVPMADMMLHQELELHGDAYIDKRGITEAEILATLNRSLELGLDSAELAKLALEVATVSKPSPRPAAVPAVPGGRRREEIADRTAGDGVDQHGKMGARARKIEVLRGQLVTTTRKLSDAERLLERTLRRAEQLESRTQALREDSRRARDRIGQLSQRPAGERATRDRVPKTQSSSVEQDRQSAEQQADSVSRYQDQLSALERRHGQALEEQQLESARERERLERQHQSAVEQRTRALRQEQAVALEANESEWKEKLEELRRDQARVLGKLSESREALEESLRQKQAELDAAGQAAAAERKRLERQHESALESLTENLRSEHAKDLESNNADWETKLAQLREEQNRQNGQRIHEQAQAEEQLRSELSEIKRRHREQIDRLKQSHHQELERLTTHHAEERERLEVEREAALEQLTQQLRAEQQQALEAKQLQWEGKPDETRRERARELAGERKELQIVLEALDAAEAVSRSKQTSVGLANPGNPFGSVTEIDPSPADHATTQTGEGSRRAASQRLRQLAEELDRLDEQSDGV